MTREMFRPPLSQVSGVSSLLRVCDVGLLLYFALLIWATVGSLYYTRLVAFSSSGNDGLIYII